MIGWLLLSAALWLSSLHSTTILYYKQASLRHRHFKPSLNQLYVISILYMLHGQSALQAINKPDDIALSVSSSSPLSLATYNKRTNLIKESPLQFLLTLNLLLETTCSISMFKQWNCFLLKINLKSKYITCYIPKGLTYPSTNNLAWQSLTSPNKQGITGTVRMLWTETKIRVPINDIAKIRCWLWGPQ